MFSLQRVFHLEENKTTVRRELLAGLTTFMTIAYVVVVNPQIFSESGCGRHREVSPLIWVLTVLFVLRYAFLGAE